MKKEKIIFDINKFLQESTESKHTLAEQITKELMMEYGCGETDIWNIKAPISKTKKKTIK